MAREDEPIQALQDLREMYFEPSPYLKTRVLAELRERRRGFRSAIFWRRVAGAVSVACLALFAWVVFQWQAPYSGRIGAPLSVRVEQSGMSGFAEMEVELPEGVAFYSASHAESVARLRVVRIALRGSAVPIVIQATESGTREIRLRFFDSGKRLVAEKSVKIRFTGKGAA